jgi:hypothetical protein
MATINYTFGNLIKGDEEKKETTTNMVMNALGASPEQRDVRVHDNFCAWLRCLFEPAWNKKRCMSDAAEKYYEKTHHGCGGAPTECEKDNTCPDSDPDPY